MWCVWAHVFPLSLFLSLCVSRVYPSIFTSGQKGIDLEARLRTKSNQSSAMTEANEGPSKKAKQPHDALATKTTKLMVKTAGMKNATNTATTTTTNNNNNNNNNKKLVNQVMMMMKKKKKKKTRQRSGSTHRHNGMVPSSVSLPPLSSSTMDRLKENQIDFPINGECECRISHRFRGIPRFDYRPIQALLLPTLPSSHTSAHHRVFENITRYFSCIRPEWASHCGGIHGRDVAAV